MKRWLGVMGIFTRKKIIKSFIFLFLLLIFLLFWLKHQCWFDRAEYQSGGLGLSRQQWESLYGKHLWHDSAEYLYRDSKFEYIVSYDSCRIASIRVYTLKDQNLTTQEIKAQALHLIPDDAERNESDNDLYFSKSLIERFPYENQRSAGTFIIEFNTNKDSEGFVMQALY